MRIVLPFARALAVWLLFLGAAACQKSKTAPFVPLVPTTNSGPTFVNPLLPSGPDPWVYQKDGFYYYMHTLNDRLAIWKTPRMSDLATTPSQVVWTPPSGSPASGNLWAPELYFFDGKWYIYYSAGPAGTNLGLQRTWVLENSSADPTTGAWADKGRIFNASADYWAIDATVLEQNGNRYLIWSGHNGIDAVQRLWISQMSNPWTLTGPRVELSRPEFPWEANGFGVNEGPEILKHAGKTFLVYSASFCGTDQYALGMLTATSTADPMVAASWTKSSQPVFSQSPANRAYATGHNSFFVSKDGTENWIVYHANSNSNEGCVEKRNPRMQKFTWNADGTPNFGVPVAIGTAITKPSGE